jgi:hypothetical protein
VWRHLHDNPIGIPVKKYQVAVGTVLRRGDDVPVVREVLGSALMVWVLELLVVDGMDAEVFGEGWKVRLS